MSKKCKLDVRAETVDGQKDERAILPNLIQPPLPPFQGCEKIPGKNEVALSFILSKFRGTPLRPNSEMKGGRGNLRLETPFVSLSIYNPIFRVVSQPTSPKKFHMAEDLHSRTLESGILVRTSQEMQVAAAGAAHRRDKKSITA